MHAHICPRTQTQTPSELSGLIPLLLMCVCQWKRHSTKSSNGPVCVSSERTKSGLFHASSQTLLETLHFLVQAIAIFWVHQLYVQQWTTTWLLQCQWMQARLTSALGSSCTMSCLGTKFNGKVLIKCRYFNYGAVEKNIFLTFCVFADCLFYHLTFCSSQYYRSWAPALFK